MTETQTRNTAHAIGAADAPVTLVEYGDYQCPYCARAKPVLEELVERAGDKVRLVFRHYPLDSVHPLARRAAEAAGAQSSFWPCTTYSTRTRMTSKKGTCAPTPCGWSWTSRASTRT